MLEISSEENLSLNNQFFETQGKNSCVFSYSKIRKEDDVYE